MTDDTDSFLARYPDGRLVRLRMKRDTDDQPARPGRSFLDCLDEVLKADASDDVDDDAGDRSDENTGLANHPAVGLATLLVASGRFSNIGDALDFVLNRPEGLSLLTRLKADQPAKESHMPDTLTSIMKSAGVGATCAAIVQKGSTSFTEHELVEAATKVAAERHPELSPSQAFAKIYTAASDEGRVCKRRSRSRSRCRTSLPTRR
jgi:hypothetical protein